MGNDRLSDKTEWQTDWISGQLPSRLLAWIQPVCICINAVPALKGLIRCPLAAWKRVVHTYHGYHVIGLVVEMQCSEW